MRRSKVNVLVCESCVCVRVRTGVHVCALAPGALRQLWGCLQCSQGGSACRTPCPPLAPSSVRGRSPPAVGPCVHCGHAGSHRGPRPSLSQLRAVLGADAGGTAGTWHVTPAHVLAVGAMALVLSGGRSGWGQHPVCSVMTAPGLGPQRVMPQATSHQPSHPGGQTPLQPAQQVALRGGPLSRWPPPHRRAGLWGAWGLSCPRCSVPPSASKPGCTRCQNFRSGNGLACHTGAHHSSSIARANEALPPRVPPVLSLKLWRKQLPQHKEGGVGADPRMTAGH